MYINVIMIKITVTVAQKITIVAMTSSSESHARNRGSIIIRLNSRPDYSYGLYNAESDEKIEGQEDEGEKALTDYAEKSTEVF